MNKIRLTEAELHAIVKESIMQVLSENEENEGFGSFIKGAAQKIGGDIKQGAQKAWNAGAQKAKNMRNAVSNYAQSVQAAGQKASNIADAQSAIKTIPKGGFDMPSAKRVALIGCGAICGNHIQGILAAGQTLCALCDLLPEKAQQAIEKYQLQDVRVYTDYREMLEREKPDAVHICTPHYCHADMVVAALEKNVHVLCEKPMALTYADCEEMLAAAMSKSGCVEGIAPVFLHQSMPKLDLYGTVDAATGIPYSGAKVATLISKEWLGTIGGIVAAIVAHWLFVLYGLI